ncbi:unnamed protein product [Schistosoma intercalatum]|nr:unnamed protein product [Schistosoma intercalatum]CAH8656858.1 unnamed protein product [Schistosoma intercalatum]
MFSTDWFFPLYTTHVHLFLFIYLFNYTPIPSQSYLLICVVHINLMSISIDIYFLNSFERIHMSGMFKLNHLIVWWEFCFVKIRVTARI